LTFSVESIVCAVMFDNEPHNDDVMDLINEDRKTTLRLEATRVPKCLRSGLFPSWVFTGKYAMPHSEHLIPFRT